MTNKEYTDEAVRLLKLLISTPSASRSEDKAADIMEETIRGYELEVHRLKNNVWTIDPEYDDARPTLGRQAIWFGKQRLWRRSDNFAPDIPQKDIGATRV